MHLNKYLLFAGLCLLMATGYTQTQTDSVFTGFGNIRLGDPQSKYLPDLVLIKGVDTTNEAHAPYMFGFNGTRPAATAPEIIPFYYFMLSFDKQRTLVKIEFSQLYVDLEKPWLRPVKRFNSDTKKIVQYFNNLTKQEGKKVIYYKQKGSTHEGYEYYSGNTKLAIDLQTQKNAKTGKRSANMGVYLERKTT